MISVMKHPAIYTLSRGLRTKRGVVYCHMVSSTNQVNLKKSRNYVNCKSQLVP